MAKQSSQHKFLVFFLCLGLLTLSGCLGIEKKTLILIVPKDSKTIQMYYVFEGLSVLKENLWQQKEPLATAKEQLTNLKLPNISFFLNGSVAQNEDPSVKKLIKFQELRFFRDQTRERPLCAEREATLLDRSEFAKQLNKEITNAIKFKTDQPIEEFQAELQKSRTELKKEQMIALVRAFGAEPLLNTADSLMELAEQIDKDSLEKIRTTATAEDGFEWVRFEPGVIRFVIPATADNAKQMVDNPKTDQWIKQMQTLVNPIRLEANQEGLSIVLGEQGKPIRLTYTDTRKSLPKHEQELIQHAGDPKPLLINGKAATAKNLIEAFVVKNGHSNE